MRLVGTFKDPKIGERLSLFLNAKGMIGGLLLLCKLKKNGSYSAKSQAISNGQKITNLPTFNKEN